MTRFTWTVIGFGFGFLLGAGLMEFAFSPEKWEIRTLNLTEKVFVQGCTYGDKLNGTSSHWNDCHIAAAENRKKLEEIFARVDVLFGE